MKQHIPVSALISIVEGILWVGHNGDLLVGMRIQQGGEAPSQQEPTNDDGFPSYVEVKGYFCLSWTYLSWLCTSFASILSSCVHCG